MNWSRLLRRVSVFVLARFTNMSSEPKKKQRWFGLESNPALMNHYLRQMGFSTDLYELVDVFSTESWALDMIPQPVAAVVMLYPLTDQQVSKETDTNVVDPQSVPGVWFIKQRIGNACGTIGLLHAVMNVPEGLRTFQSGSWLQEFAADCPPMLDPVAKAERLESDETIATLHDAATSSESNQTDRGNLDDKLITHFIALIESGGILYELDGRKTGPVSHGPTTPMTLLQDSCKVVKKYMENDPEEMRFTIIALAPKQD